MSDTRGAEAPEGGGEEGTFAEEFAKLALEEQELPSDNDGPPDDDSHQQGDPDEAPDDSGHDGSDPSPLTPDADTPSGSETQDDIWAKAPPELRAAFEAERKAREEAQGVLRTQSGRLSTTQRELAELKRRQAGTPAEGEGSQPGEAEDERAKRLAATKDEYPDVTSAIIDEVTDLRSQLAELLQDRTRAAEAEAKQAELDHAETLAANEAMLVEKFPDWQEVVESEAFTEWALKEPKIIHEGILANANGIVDPASALKIIGDFKRDTASDLPATTVDPLAEKRRLQREGGAAIPARTATAPAKGGETGSYSDEWKRLAREEQRREAARAGRRY